MSTRFYRPQLMHRGRHRLKRAKTFDSEAKAKAWAAKESIKDFKIVRLNSGISRKVKIVSND